MESCDYVYGVKPQKADALTRRISFTNVSKMLQLMEVFVAVALISWSSIRLPLAFKLSGEYLLVFTSYLMNQHVVFLVGNVIVFVCYVLSRYTDSNDSGGFRAHSELTHRRTVTDAISDPQPLLVTETPSETVIETVAEPEVVVVTAIKQAEKQIERFRRTQSDLKRKISLNRHRELRRTLTEGRRRGVTTSCDGDATVRSFPAVDELSNEEFRVAVETFILKQQRFLKQQRMVEDGS